MLDEWVLRYDKLTGSFYTIRVDEDGPYFEFYSPTANPSIVLRTPKELFRMDDYVENIDEIVREVYVPERGEVVVAYVEDLIKKTKLIITTKDNVNGRHTFIYGDRKITTWGGLVMWLDVDRNLPYPEVYIMGKSYVIPRSGYVQLLKRAIIDGEMKYVVFSWRPGFVSRMLLDDIDEIPEDRPSGIHNNAWVFDENTARLRGARERGVDNDYDYAIHTTNYSVFLRGDEGRIVTTHGEWKFKMHAQSFKEFFIKFFAGDYTL